MKAVLASTLTALVLVSAAWASNVTPAQLSALSKRVTKLEHANTVLSARVAALACLKLTPFTSYDETIDFNDGSTLKFSTLETPAAGDAPTYWIPVSSTSSCASTG